MDLLAKQIELVLNAPAIFASIVIVLAGATWAIFAWVYKQRLDGKDAVIDLLRAEISDYKRKLDGKTPDEAQAELRALRDIIRDGVGYRWAPLSSAEADQLVRVLDGAVSSQSVHIMYQSELGRDLAESIAPTLERAGMVVKLTTGGGFDPGINVGHGSVAADRLEAALGSIARLGPIKRHRLDTGNVPFTFIGVGICRASGMG